MYYGHAKTESLLVEATQALSDVQLSTVPGGLTQPRHRYDAKLPNLPTESQEGYADDTGSNVWSPDRQSPIVTTGGSFFPPYASQSQPSSPFSYAPPHQGAVDDFGILPTRSSGSGPMDIGGGGGGGGGGRFATFPVKTREGGVGYTLRDEPLSSSASAGTNTNTNAREQQQQPSLTTTTQPPSLNTNTRHELDVSFSMSVAEALNSAGGVDDQPWARTATMSDAGGPTPTSAIQPLPPGAAAALPEGDNPWSLPPLGGAGSGLGRGERGGLLGLGTPGQTLGGKQGRHVSNQSIVSDDDDALLAYMLNADADDGEDLAGGRGRGDRHSLAAAQPAVTPTAQPAATATTQPVTVTSANGLTTQGTNTSMDEDRERGQSRHVRFGGSGQASESGEAEEWRRSLEERRTDAHASTTPPWQGETDSKKGTFRLISSRCGLIECITSSTSRNDYYTSPNYGIPPNIDYQRRCAYFSHSRRHWQTHPSALSQPTGKRRGRGRRGRREGVECSCCTGDKSGDGSIGVQPPFGEQQQRCFGYRE